VARASWPGEGYHKYFFNIFHFVPLTRRFAAPSPVGRGIRKNIPLILRVSQNPRIRREFPLLSPNVSRDGELEWDRALPRVRPDSFLRQD
jgi:hypothetical protein